jgi:hypothetical protein
MPWIVALAVVVVVIRAVRIVLELRRNLAMEFSSPFEPPALSRHRVLLIAYAF